MNWNPQSIILNVIIFNREIHLAEASEEAADALRKIACSFCGKRFRTRAHVKQHENAHQGIRKYVCKICNRAFTWAAEC